MPTRFTYEIELHRWHPSKADQPPSRIDVMGGATDQQIAWEYGRALLRTCVNTETEHYRIQVWRKKSRGIAEKLVWEMTRAEMDRKNPPAANNCPSGVPHSSMTDGVKWFGQDELRLTFEYLASIIHDSGSNHEAITLHVNKIRAMLPDFEKLA